MKMLLIVNRVQLATNQNNNIPQHTNENDNNPAVTSKNNPVIVDNPAYSISGPPLVDNPAYVAMKSDPVTTITDQI